MSPSPESAVDNLYTWIREVRDDRDARLAAVSGLRGVVSLFGIRLRPRRAPFTFTVTQVERMLQVEDKRAIRPLLVALSLPVGRLRPQVIFNVTRLLLSLGETDSLAMLGSSRWRLYQILEDYSPNRDPHLLVAVLHALGTCGNADDMRAIQSWALQRYHTNAEQAIAMATAHCLDAIRGRGDAARASETLLRSVSDRKEPLELLRPTPVSPYHEPDKLLRNVE